MFGLVAVAQLAVPFRMISRKQRVVDNGTEYKFKLRPVDPTDPFRGEYVILNYAALDGAFALPDTSRRTGEFDGFALLGQGPDGFVRITGLAEEEPVTGDYIRVTGWKGTYDAGGTDSIRGLGPEFDRYYLEEGGGHIAEDLVRWRPDTNALREAYAVVRVYKGDGVVRDLIIGGRPVRQWVEEKEAEVLPP